MKLLIKYSAKKVQNDVSFRIVMQRKLVKVYLNLKKLEEPRSTDTPRTLAHFIIQENEPDQNAPLERSVHMEPKESGLLGEMQQAEGASNAPASAVQERGCESRPEPKNVEDPWSQNIFRSFNVESSPEGLQKEESQS